MASLQDVADEHVAAFNAAVVSGDFTAFLLRFDDDAVIRFENVPGAGVLEFAGRAAYTAAYARQPPDGCVDIAGPVRPIAGGVEIPFRWRRDGAPGTMRAIVDGDRIGRFSVVFGAESQGAPRS